MEPSAQEQIPQEGLCPENPEQEELTLTQETPPAPSPNLKVTLSRTELLSILTPALGAIDRRGTMPILSHVLLEAGENEVSLQGTDLELFYRAACPAQVRKAGCLAVPALTLNNLIKALPGDDLTLEGDQRSVKLTGNGSVYKLPALPAEQFPPVPVPDPEDLTEVPAPVIREMIRKTGFSMATDDLQYALSSLLWEQVEDRLRLVSTDGHRLTLIDRPLTVSLPDGGIMVPRKACAMLEKLLDGRETVRLGTAGDNKILGVAIDRQTLSIHLLDKKFPDYRRILEGNQEYSFRFAFKRQELVDKLKRLSSISSERFKGVVFELSSDRAELTFLDPDVGEGKEVVDLTLERGDPGGSLPMKAGFNAKYILDPLTAMPGGTVYLDMNEPARPCRLADADEGEAYLCMVMPMDL